MSYPYSCFKTIENVSLEKLKKKRNINSLFATSNNEQSILINYKKSIEEYKKKIKINNLEFRILEKLSENFDNNKKNTLEKFFKELVLFKDMLSTNNINIKHFILFSKKINNFNLNLYNKDLCINNPINSKNIGFGFFDEDYFKNINTYNEDIREKIEKTLDILLLGQVINFSLPSVGPITNYLSKKNKYNYIEFINELLLYKNDDSKIEKIPLLSLDIGNILSDKLLNFNISKLKNNNNYDFNNDNMRNLIINMVKSINININDIFYTNYERYNKKMKKINNEFIIPYKLSEDDKNPISIINITKSDIDKINNLEKLLLHNNSIACYVINDIFKKNTDEALKNLEKENYKNVLACYLFYIINLVYNIIKYYVDKIDKILENIIDSKEKRFTILNIKSAFSYTTLLNKSLLNFNKILLNSFYHLFIPSRIVNGNYGMKVNELGCYVPESVFLGSNDKLFDNYIFKNCLDNTIIMDKNDEEKLIIFLTLFNSKTDIYKNNIKLEFGGLVYNNFILKNSIKILINYYKILENNNIFSIFIINKLIDNFKNKQCFPIEFIQEYYDLFREINSINNYNDIEKKIVNKFDIQIQKSTNYFFKLTDVKNKIKKLDKTGVKTLNIQEEILRLNFNAYRFKTLALTIIAQNIIKNSKLKNNLLKIFSKKKIENLKLIKKYLEKV